MTDLARQSLSHVLRDGVHAVMVTPFLPDESLDLASLSTLIDGFVDVGCDGVLVLGVMGEADRLSDLERDDVINHTIATAAERLQVTVGITHGSTKVAAERAQAAARVGATAVMVSPPIGSVAGSALRDHFRRIADDLPIPIVIQDHPASSGVKLPVDFLHELIEVVPPGSTVKLEDPPSALKIKRLRWLSPDIQILGGLGGVPLLDELDAGADGVMTGFALPEVLVGIVRAYQSGNHSLAREQYIRALPLMLFESQPGAGPGLRKELLAKRGLIAHPTVRQPGARPGPWTLQHLDKLLAEWNAFLDERTNP